MKDAVKMEAQSIAQDRPPDPFEDLAAPPLRLTPRPKRARVVPFPQPQAAKVEPVASLQVPGAVAAEPPAAGRDGGGPRAIRALPQDKRASGSRREVGLALALGSAIAAGIVAAAVYLRPLPADPQIGSGLPPAGLEAAATPVSDVTVRLRLPAGVDAARTDALRDALAAAGFVRVDVSTPAQPIGPARVEFSHPEDRAAAETLAEALGPLAGGEIQAAPRVPEAGSGPMGHIELWIGE